MDIPNINSNILKAVKDSTLPGQKVLTFIDVPKEKIGPMIIWANKLRKKNPKMKWPRMAKKVADEFHVELGWEEVKDDRDNKPDTTRGTEINSGEQLHK